MGEGEGGVGEGWELPKGPEAGGQLERGKWPRGPGGPRGGGSANIQFKETTTAIWVMDDPSWAPRSYSPRGSERGGARWPRDPEGPGIPAAQPFAALPAQPTAPRDAPGQQVGGKLSKE